MKHGFLGLAAVALAALGPSVATAQDFVPCDGYETPKTKGDGMTTSPLLWGLASSSADIRETPLFSFDAGGVAACDRALADPRLLPGYQLRRAHLLQAKAIHQIGASQPEQALATLAQSDAVGAALEGPYFRDSVGLGNHAARAFALISLDRKAEAIREIELIEAARPDAPSMLRLTTLLRMRLDHSLAAHMALLKQRAVRDPAALISYFVIALTSGKLTEAAAVGGSMSFDLPSNRGGWTVEGDVVRQYELIADRADLMGAYAYALAASGKPAEATAVIARTRQDLTEAMAPPPAPEPGRSLSKTAARDYAARTAQGERGQTTISTWESAIDLRQKPGGRSDELIMIALQSLQKGHLPIMADLLGQLKMANPQTDAARQGAIAKIDAATERARVDTLRLDLAALHDLLPRPETAAMQPHFKHSGDGYFLSDNGFSRRRLDEPNSWTVRFTHDLASKASVEELALLSAATLAQKEGFDGLLILSRRTLERTTHVTGMYIAARDVPTGNEAQLNVLLVKGGALPERFRDSGWRLVSAQAVIDELAGRYPTAR